MKDGDYYVYILSCRDGAYYVGVTNDLDRRLAEHDEGTNSKAFTFSRRPVRLVYFEQFQDINFAIEREKQLKGWTVRKKRGSN